MAWFANYGGAPALWKHLTIVDKEMLVVRQRRHVFTAERISSFLGLHLIARSKAD